jgi:hypothetical protein
MAWLVINGVSAVAPLVAVPLVSSELKRDLLAGAAVSGASAVVTLLWPLDVEAYGALLECEGAPSAREDVSYVEQLARAAGRDEALRVSWPWHVANLAVSGALGAVLALGFGHRTGGAITAASSFVAGEAQLLTQPTGLIEW